MLEHVEHKQGKSQHKQGKILGYDKSKNLINFCMMFMTVSFRMSNAMHSNIKKVCISSYQFRGNLYYRRNCLHVPLSCQNTLQSSHNSPGYFSHAHSHKIPATADRLEMFGEMKRSRHERSKTQSFGLLFYCFHLDFYHMLINVGTS